MPAGYPGARSAQRLRDDIAIVVLQNGGVPAELNLELPADARSLAGLRRGLRRWLRSHGPSDDDVAEMTLAVNEACGPPVMGFLPGCGDLTRRSCTQVSIRWREEKRQG